MALIQLDGELTVHVVVDPVSGQVASAWIDRDAVSWLAPSWVLPRYRRALIGTHEAAIKAATNAPTWGVIHERNLTEEV